MADGRLQDILDELILGNESTVVSEKMFREILKIKKETIEKLRAEVKELNHKLSEEMYKIAVIDGCLDGNECPKDWRGWTPVAEKAKMVYRQQNQELLDLIKEMQSSLKDFVKLPEEADMLLELEDFEKKYLKLYGDDLKMAGIIVHIYDYLRNPK